MNLKTLSVKLSILLITGKLFAQAPDWEWAKSAGGNFSDMAHSVALDDNGNVLVTGFFASDSLPFDTIVLNNSGMRNMFVAKYDPAGNILWAKSGDYNYDAWGSGVTADAFGNVYVTGSFSDSIVFGNTTLTTISGGFYTFYIVKYDSSGNVIWAKSTDGAGIQEFSYSISADGNEGVIVSGSFGGPSIIFGATTLLNSGSSDLFTVKYDSSGNTVWAKSAGGTEADHAFSNCIDLNGSVLVSGSFSSPNITFGNIVLTNSSSPSQAMFVVKYDSTGNVLWAKSAQGNGWESSYGVTSDGNGNILVAGFFNSPGLTFDSLTLNITGSFDHFIVKYGPGGNVIWANNTNGIQDYMFGNKIIADSTGEFFLTGLYAAPSITFGTTVLTNMGFEDLFLTKYDSFGNVLWAKSAGGTYYDRSYCIAADDKGNVAIAGYFESPTITFGSNTLNHTFYGDMFVAKLSNTTGLTEINSVFDELVIFPNPGFGQFQLRSSNQIDEIQVYNALGEIVYHAISNENTHDLLINDQGMYMLRIKAGKHILFRKLLILNRN